ncbi:MAG: histidine kinase [Burkholderiales bacterium]
MPTDHGSTAAPPAATMSPYATPSAKKFLRHGVHVALAAVVIAAVLTIAQDGDFWVKLVYAEAISLCSWAAIDFGRFLFKPHPQTGWPQGWRAVALPFLGCVVGYVVGQQIGDAVFGWSSFSAYRHGHRPWIKDVLLSAVIGFLFSLFYYLRGRNAFHRAQVATSERDATLAKLGMLQSQLEPHMLFNTLANLRVLIGIDPPRAQAMLDRLIAFLRATLSASRSNLHPLQAEFDRLQDYLTLMAMRMGPRLVYSLELPAELQALLVPPLLLQPLVENSIKHGLEPKVAGGRIDVCARREGERLVLTVRDTGLGLGAGSSLSGGFGVSQVQERLATLYGDAASLTLAQVDDDAGGTLATLVFPTTPPAFLAPAAGSTSTTGHTA